MSTISNTVKDELNLVITPGSAARHQIGTQLQDAVGSHKIKFAGQATTAGGAAAEAITVTGVLATDLAFVVLETKGASPQTILTSVCTADTLTVTFSADPSTDHVVNYMILRAIS